MSKQYITKPLKCVRCGGTGLEYNEGYAMECLMCNGVGERMVTLPAEEWEKEEKKNGNQGKNNQAKF